MYLFDAHSHIPKLDLEDLGSLLSRAGIRAVICVGEGEVTQGLINIRQNGLIYIFNDIPPSSSGQHTDLKPFDGIGEIGMDPSYEGDIALQRRTFELQLNIAEKRRLPVAVHSRGAASDVLEIISSYSLAGVLLHWFEGSDQEFKSAMERGYFISVSPIIIYNKRMKKYLIAYEHGQLLLETDSPVHYGALNLDSNQTLILSVYFAASNHLGVDFNEFAANISSAFTAFMGSHRASTPAGFG